MEREGIFETLNGFFSFFVDKETDRIEEEFAAFLRDTAADEEMTAKVTGLRIIYERALAVVEKRAAESGFDDRLLKLQRDLYGELEYLLALREPDGRHHFIVVIPVADRPVMLGNCVESLIEQCRIFGYGGTMTGPESGTFFRKISLFIVDDSREPENIETSGKIAERARSAGIASYYIGLDEQAKRLQRLPRDYRERLSGLVGKFNGTVPPHKGASISRNIAYLCIQSMINTGEIADCGGSDRHEKMLVYFLDSDEEFRIRTSRGTETVDVQFINYFYWIDRIFESHEIMVMTGKVVGDPPVTPAVMINTFLEDLDLFFEIASGRDIHDDCPFHGTHGQQAFSADYHDMVKLFGYGRSSSPKEYICDLKKPHTMEDCLLHLSEKAVSFFYGLHPTRVQFYTHAGDFTKTENARTVYTGNYVFSRDGLRHFIPFADLGLRMAGPTLGRILKSKLGEGFVSANLPLLHKRTILNAPAGFRSGIRRDEATIDLSQEFYRQFWGDVMLFSVEALASAGYPVVHSDFQEIVGTVYRTQNHLWELYREKAANTGEGIAGIRRHLSSPGCRVNASPKTEEAVGNFLRFCDLAEDNFGKNSVSYRKISEQISEGSQTNLIIDAIHLYCEDESAWNELIRENEDAADGV